MADDSYQMKEDIAKLKSEIAKMWKYIDDINARLKRAGEKGSY